MLALRSAKIAVTVSIIAVVRMAPPAPHRMQGRTVKKISHASKNRRPVGDFRQQVLRRPRASLRAAAKRIAASKLAEQFQISD
jgi:hypothetical protein